MKYYHTFMIIMVVFTAGVSFLSSYVCCPMSYGAMGKESASNIKEVVLRVEGMTCNVCPLTIKTALKKLTGVVDADVSYEDKEAKVLFEEGKVTVEQVIHIIEDTGNYKVVVKEQ